ncbi:TrbI/VirB10 family protein [Aquincola sp. S2]|uniref:TrbI/VirB10 family protein n=1 Tax=Pseudaquabacterium terrae TaxID=2732868 RepID=A0ABX2ERR5_9BURK|nr:TrbI/VirB10 family protein [Aquabacterium terrae]NRF71374.1 TrbI/VirB10 family protein [Aquabacterium terrae]
MTQAPNTVPYEGNGDAQLTGDAVPGLAPQRRSGVSATAILALSLLALSVVVVASFVAKRFLDSRREAQPDKAPPVASANAQKLRLGDARAGTVPTGQAASAPAPAASGPIGERGQRVPAIREAGDVQPIPVVRTGAGAGAAPNSRAAGSRAGQPQQTINPIDAPVFSGQARGAAPRQHVSGNGSSGRHVADQDAAGGDDPVRESMDKAIEDLKAHRLRLQAKLDSAEGSLVGGQRAPNVPSGLEYPNPWGPGASNRPGDADGNTSRLLGGIDHSATPKVRAQKPFNRSLTIPQGVIIPCTLQTRIVTATSGFISCIAQRDITGHDGKVVLVDKGSHFNGEYRIVNVKPGLTRIPVIWTRILTPQAVSVDLESPAVGQLGESGIGGYVDNRWPERIGAALLVSLIEDAIKLAGGSDDKGGERVYLPSTAERSSSLAEEVLKSTINIPPLMYQNQGGVVGVRVARDLDFSSVYKLVPQ